jgi:hypothetical protein
VSSDPVIVRAKSTPRRGDLVLPSIATSIPTTAHNHGPHRCPRGNSTREWQQECLKSLYTHTEHDAAYRHLYGSNHHLGLSEDLGQGAAANGRRRLLEAVGL